MDKHWEEFTQKAAGKGDSMRVSLNARGYFALNQKALETLGSPEAVVLMFDRANKLIGLKASSPDVSHAYQVKRQGTSQSYFVRAKSFCNFYGIEIADTIVFNDPQLEDEMIVLNLDSVTETFRRPKPVGYSEDAYEPEVPSQPAKFSTLLRMKMHGGD